MIVVKWWWRWLLICLFKCCVKSQVAVRNNVGHTYYNNYQNNPNNHYTNLPPAPRRYANNYYALQRRPYAATGAQRAHNRVDYNSRVGYHNTPMQSSYSPQQSKAHSIIYANQMNQYGPNRVQNARNYWAEWSTWSKCSKPCNGGVKTRIRVCKSRIDFNNNYPTNGVVSNNCVGYRRGYQACNAQICMTKAQMKQKKHQDRELLCGRHNKVMYHGETYKWIPYMRVGLSECKLNCLADGHKIFKSFGNVNDGMMCGHDDGYTCQHGHCKKTKANNQPSSKPTDRSSSGIINPRVPTNPVQSGNNIIRKWIYVKKNFVKTTGMAIGYNHVLRLPRGAVNITIKEQAPSYNFFALKIGKLFILNGRWQIKSNKLFYAASSIFRYVVARTTGKTNIKTLETIFSPGPLAEAVDVIVLYRRSIINITYEYTLPGPVFRQKSIIHGVSHFPPQTGRYQQARQQARLNSAPNYRYTSGQNNVPYNSAQNNVPYNAAQNNAPYNSAQNNVPYNSAQGNVPYNSAPNNVPYNPRVIQRKPYRVVVPRLPLGRPKSAVVQQVVYKWQIGGIAKCTAKCNGGEQEYTYRCFVSQGKSGKFVDDSNCQHIQRPPPRKRVCNLEACPLKWIATDWSKCSKECGRNNTQRRTVVCNEFQHGSKSSYKVHVNSSKCEQMVKPVLVKECEYIPCTYNWKVGPWGKCSKECDHGLQRRYVLCQNSKHHYFPRQKCKDTSKPNNTRICLKAHCSAEWYVSEWGVCTSACGDGMQKRTVVCRGSSGVILSHGFCESQTKPKPERTCTGSVCNNGFWVTSPWSKCSTHCGTGNQYRKVFCATISNNALVQVNDKMCLTSQEPNKVQICVNEDCNPLWHTTNWQECSVTCGRGIQRRQRICMSEDGKLGRGCFYKLRPTLLQFCSQPSCTSTVFGVDGAAKRTTLTRFSSLLKRRYRPSTRVQREKSIIPLTLPSRSSTTSTSQASTTTVLTTTTTTPSVPTAPTTTPPTTTTTTTTTTAAPTIASTRRILTKRRVSVNKEDDKLKVTFVKRTRDEGVRAGIISPPLRRNVNSRQPVRVIAANNRIDIYKPVVRTPVPSTTEVPTTTVPTTMVPTTMVPTTMVPTTKARIRASERDKSSRRKTAKAAASANSSTNADKSVNKTCVDFYSPMYCKVIATRLKFCRLDKFRRGCCYSCRGK